MSRIIVVGGRGRSGKLVIEQLVAAKHSVIATIRNPRHKGAMTRLGAASAILDLGTSTIADFATAFAGADAIVFAAGSAAGQTSEIDRVGTIKTVKAAEKAGVKRYVTISSIGASTGMSTRTMSDEMKDYYRQKRLAGKAIRASSLDWTILEPAELTDGPGTGKGTISQQHIKETPVSRADVAATVVAILQSPATIGKTYQLAGGTTAIKTALARATA